MRFIFNLFASQHLRCSGCDEILDLNTKELFHYEPPILGSWYKEGYYHQKCFTKIISSNNQMKQGVDET